MSHAQRFILPAYLLLCLILGGGSQAIWGNAILQLLAIPILAWAILSTRTQSINRPARSLLLIAAAALLLVLLQLVPLPPGIWTALPGRDQVETGFRLLAVPLLWLPLSLAPQETIAAALGLLPPLALLVGMLRLRDWDTRWMLAATMAGAAISIVLGILQVGAGSGESWYLYRRTNHGVAVGIFANGNHFATLLLATLPLLVVLALGPWRAAAKPQDRSLILALAAGGAALLGIGVLMNGSTAMLLLGPPVLAATVLLVMRRSPRTNRRAMLLIGLMVVAATAALPLLGKHLPSWGASASIETRMEYWSKTLAAAHDHGFTGTGIGTFEEVYRGYEDPGSVDRWYINHAHNDYLELLLEGGVPAALLMVLLLWWWMSRTREAWGPAGRIEQRGAAIAAAAILLHSVIDYPLRTQAIAALLALCLALLAGARGRGGQELAPDERPRHATL